MNSSYIIRPDDLKKDIDNYIIVDCRKKSEYVKGHIPNAILLPIDYWLKEDNEEGIARGTNIISKEAFEHLMTKMHISNSSQIVAYDDNEGRGATRFWTVAKYYGHKLVSVLDGGWNYWKYLNNNVTSSSNKLTDCTDAYIAEITDGYIIRLSEFIEKYNEYVFVDTRSQAEWSGRDIHNNPRNGHLPNSIHVEWSELLNNGEIKCFNSIGDIEKHLTSRGIHKDMPIITYCQAGIRSAHTAFLMKEAGYGNVKIYDASMQEWARNAALRLEDESCAE